MTAERKTRRPAELADRAMGLWRRLLPPRKGDAALAIDQFQSDAGAIERLEPPRLMRSTLYALSAAIAFALVWASLSEIDKIVVAPGKLVTTTRKMAVAPLEMAVVRSIDVGIGDIVRKGAPLAHLDPTFASADLGQLERTRDSLTVREARLAAELAGTSFVSPRPDLPETAIEAMVFEDGRRQRQARLRSFDEQRAHVDASIRAREQDRAIYATRLEAAREVESMRQRLHDAQTGTRLQLLQARDTRLSMERELQAAANALRELGHERENVLAQRESYLNEWRQKAGQELASVKVELNKAEEQIAKARRRHEMVVLTAPADAIVLEVAQRSTGSVVKEADPLITLVPLDAPLEGEVMIPVADIGPVAVGNQARVKVEAFPFQRHGTLAGHVRVISGDAFAVDPDRAGGEPVRRDFYRAMIEIGPETLRNLPGGYRLLPGMAVTAEIKVGTRTVLSYLLYPLMRSLDESMREP